MKLSKIQESVLREAKAEIDKAREFNTFEEYFEKYEAPGLYDAIKKPEDYIRIRKNGAEEWKSMVSHWEEKRRGIVWTKCNSRTLYKLEEYGLIEIIVDGKNRAYSGMDTIRVLNY